MPTRPPSLRAVAAFEAAARHESFAKAADELNLSHSAISHAIRGLEQRLGSELFARVGRCVALTPEGARLAQRLSPTLTDLTSALDNRSAALRSRLKVGAEPAIVSRLLAPRLSAFRGLYPAIAFDLRCQCSPEILLDGDLDIVLRTGASRTPGVATRLIARERLFPVAAPHLQIAPNVSDAPGACLVESREHPWSLWYSRFKRPAGLDAPAVRVDTDLVAIEMARAGVGVCLAPALLVENELQSGLLRRLGDECVPARSAYYLEWSHGTLKAPEISIFLAWMTKVLGAEPEAKTSGRWTRESRLAS